MISLAELKVEEQTNKLFSLIDRIVGTVGKGTGEGIPVHQRDR
jgi:hypothetical protein